MVLLKNKKGAVSSQVPSVPFLLKSKKGAVKNPKDFFGTIFKNKKGMELTLNTIIILIILIIVMVVIIIMFVKYYGANSTGIDNIGSNAINISKNYK